MSAPTPAFKTIGLITKPDDARLADTVRALLECLSAHGLEVLVDRSAGVLLQDTGLEGVSREEIGRRCELAIVVGGDGTLLHAARSLIDSQVPLLGINRGRLGFLADISPDETSERLGDILRGRFRAELRTMLHAEVERDGETQMTSAALNDVVVHVYGTVRMIELELYVDGRFVNLLRADGLIVATPTGSTAYALSGGGPILSPGLEAVALVPICPHTLSNRPIVVSADSRIEVVLCANNTVSAHASFDGQAECDLAPGDRIRITRREPGLRLVQSPDHDYFTVLRAKLRWG